jgi:type IV secretory pathway VirB2 component (pilin)
MMSLANQIERQASLADPPATSVVAPAARWVEALLMGNAATAVAVIAVASVGIAMLSGRIEIRRGLFILLGCFVLFGASSIAKGLRAAAQGEEATITAQSPPAPVFPKPKAGTVNPQNSGYDPYAGAAVPVER